MIVSCQIFPSTFKSASGQDTSVSFFLDSISPFWYLPEMDLIVVKVDHGSGSFRIVIPQKLVQEMEWEQVGYVVVRKHLELSLIIRSLKYDVDEEG